MSADEPRLDDAPIVDAHAHIWTRDMPLGANAWHEPEYGYSAEDYLRTLDENGVQISLKLPYLVYGAVRLQKPSMQNYIVEAIKAALRSDSE